MAFYPLQTNFTAGELSPRLSLRVDFNKYANGLEALENYIVLPHGGVQRRPGLRFVSEVKDSTRKTRLIPFEFSTEQAYILEFGHQYIRFYMDGGQIVSGVPVEVVTPYVEADLFDLQYAQSADTLYIVHPAYAPRKLTRFSHTSWTLSPVDFLDGPYFDENLTMPHTARSTITITPSAATGSSVTLTASEALFAPTDVGRPIRLKQGSTWGWAIVTDYNSPTQVVVNVKSTLTNTNPKSTWRLGAWSSAPTIGYPGVITFFEDRLAFARSQAQPQTVWLSRTGDYEDMEPSDPDGTVTDDHALTYTIASNQVNAIMWLSSSVGLLLGTTGGEFALFGGNDSPLTPTNVTVRRQSTHGSLRVMPVAIGGSTLFVQRSGMKIRELSFKADSGVYQAPDVTLFAEHITAPRLVELSYQQEPDSIVWCVRADGKLISLTYNPIQDVIAFARHSTDGDFESVATIPHPDGNADQTWVIVKRTIGEVTKRYVEYFDYSLYVDSGLTYSGSPTTGVSGLSHLNGKTVDINGDGAVYPRKIVSVGSVALDGPAASSIQAGLPYTPTLKTLRPEVRMANGGTSLGQPKHWAELYVRVYKTLGLTINGDEYTFRSGSDQMDSPPPLFSGDVRVSLSGWSKDGQHTIQQDQPVPSTILGFFGTLVVGGESG